MGTLAYTVLILGVLGALCALLLFVVAKKFRVDEDPRIDDVERMLPGANCGGCGFAGCRAMAENLVKQDDISALYCPVGGKETMQKAAGFLGKVAPEKDPVVAVVRCNGTCDNRPKTNRYDGTMSCFVLASLYAGETGCAFGCLGKGDCVKACEFGALSMDAATGLPKVDIDKCTGCGKCSQTCPKGVIEMRKKWPKGRMVFVRCNNKEKGGIARKSCAVACIGCMKCQKACKFGAIESRGNLAWVDSTKCRLCRSCVEACPTGAMVALNFPAPKPVLDMSQTDASDKNNVKE